MNISANITRRALLGLLGAFGLLPLTGCDTTTPATADAPKGGIDELPLEKGELLVPSDHSPVSGNAAWCAPMQICWDMLEDEYNAGQPIPEDGQPGMVANLNNGSFETSMVGENHYVTYVGPATSDAKTEIETLIDERFNQKSDILDMISWSDDPATAAFLFYAMLYREFTYELAFDVLPSADFGSEESGNLTKNVRYFGSDGSSDYDVRTQAMALFWDSEERFAVQIKTNEGDKLILARGAKGSTFDELWEDVYNSSDFTNDNLYIAPSVFACPMISVNTLREYTEIEGVSFKGVDGQAVSIGQALQTLRFKLDEKGGTIKSEAIMNAYGSGPATELHSFRFNDSFVLFLVDGNVAGKGYPYAALKVDNIEDFI